MKDKDLLTLIADELSSADQSLDYETPLDYYLGNPRGDEVEGRSSVISTDVADAIEWIMPQIMKSFTQNNEVVIFDPIHPEDEFQAELESQYVYEVLMKENDGFITLHQLVKDCLMQNNGFIKVWYEDHNETKVVNYTGLTENELVSVMATPHAEIIEQETVTIIDTSQPQLPQPQPQLQPQVPQAPQAQAPQAPQSQFPTVQRINAKVQITTENGKICIESVPPEDVRLNADHNSINPDNARFAAHLMTKTISELREEGVAEKILKELGQDEKSNGDSDYRFTAQGEHSANDSDPSSDTDDSLREVQIAECYMHADINDDGIAEYVKITVGGHQTPNVVIDKEEIACSPWISTTAILMSHKWRGLSIYDRLRQIQDIKTTLIRNTLDNIYLQNNQRHLVLEGQATMSDLMTSRPGGVIRVKSPNAVTPLVTPSVSDSAFQMLGYMDQIRAGRAGVSPEDSFKEHKIGERVGSEGVERILNAKEELVGLIVRVVAETGIKPLCYKIRNIACRHLDAIRDFKFRGQWQRVNPSLWPPRTRATVRVGTGSGHHQKQIMALGQVMQKQSELMQMPGQILVDYATQFKAIDDFCKFSNLNSAVGYFIDPNSPEGQAKQQQVMEQNQQEAQAAQEQQVQQFEFQRKLANAETEKARAAMYSVELRGEVEKTKAAMQHVKQQYELDIKDLEQQLKEAEAIGKQSLEREKLDFQREQFAGTTALELTKLEQESNKDLNADYQDNEKAVSDAA